MRSLRSIPLYALAGALLSSVAMAQSPAVRIVTPVDESQLVTLKGNVNPHANAANDRGAVSANLQMAGLTLVLSRSQSEQAAFDAFVASQYDQSSPNFHRWLTPQQIGAQYGPAQADIDTLSNWLAGQGFAVTTVGADHMSIQFRGSAGQVESAFHTEIHHVSVAGKEHIANMTEPEIPAAFAPVIAGIRGLHNFLPHPLHRMGSKVRFDSDAHGWARLQPASTTGSIARPFTRQTSGAAVPSGSSAQPSFYSTNGYLGVEEDVAPFDFAKIYNLPSGWPSTVNGSGQTITIIGTSDIDLTDVANFKSSFGLPAGSTPVIAHGPDGDPGICTSSTNACGAGDLDENSLDVEWSGAVAPGAQVVLVTDAYNNQQNPTNDPLYDGAQWAIDNVATQGSPVYGSHILSLSYGQCELFNGTASNVAYNNLWETAASAGIAVFVATGDSGAPACDDGYDVNDGNPYEAQFGLSVSGLASSQYDTAVGGTDFSWCNPTLITSGSQAGYPQGCASTNASTYWNTSNSSTTQASAKGYVPETPWNDTCENPINAAFLESIASYIGGLGTYSTAEESCNFVYKDSIELYFVQNDPALMPYVDTVGGSGGGSNCVVNTSTSTTIGSCNSSDTSTGSSYGNLTLVTDGWPKPGWQSGITGIPSDGVRDIPDISFFAGDGTLDSATLICVSNDGAMCTSIGETDSGNGTGGAEEVGGTSVATPEMAGVMALINQNSGASQGNPNAELYKLAGQQTYSSCSSESGSNSSGCYFNDIDKGTIAMPCATSTGILEGGAYYEGSGYWGQSQPTFAQQSPNCTVVDSGDGVGTLSGYSATTGYDAATGLGSLNIGNVLYGWQGVSAVPSGFAGYGIDIKSPSTTSSTSATGTLTVFSENGYSGTVALTCTGSTGTTCTLGSSSVALSASATSQSVNISVTFPSTTSKLARPASPVRDRQWLGAGGSAVLALLVFFGIPARRRSWRAMLGAMVLMVFLGSMSACGGSTASSGGSGGGSGTVTAGTYTFTVTATGTPSISGAQSQQFTVTVD